MCYLCIEIAKENMTPTEIAKAYREVVDPRDDGHWVEVMTEIYKHSNLKEVADAMYALRRDDK